MNFTQILNEISDFKKREIAHELRHEKMEWRVLKKTNGNTKIVKSGFYDEGSAEAYARACNRKAPEGTKFTTEEY